EELRRIEGASGQDHLPRGAHLATLPRSLRGTAMGVVEPLSAQVLDTDGAMPLVEEDARGERVELETEAPGEPARRLEHALPRSCPRMAMRGEGHVADAHRVLLHESPVVEIELALDEPSRAPDRLFVEGAEDLARGGLDQAEERPIVDHGLRNGLLRMEPPLPSVPRGIDADLGQEAIRPSVVAVLELLGVAPHAAGAPGRIAGEAGGGGPVRGGGVGHDEWVCSGARAPG